MIAHGFFLGAFFMPEKVVCVLIFPGQLSLFSVDVLKVMLLFSISTLKVMSFKRWHAESGDLLAIGREGMLVLPSCGF